MLVQKPVNAECALLNKVLDLIIELARGDPLIEIVLIQSDFSFAALGKFEFC